MVAVQSIAIPAHASLDFASLGYHLMLEQARASIAPGQTLSLVLRFADGGMLRIAASVRPPDGTPAARTAPGSMPGMPDMPGMSGMSGMPGMSNTPK
jgi:hypothetical protein